MIGYVVDSKNHAKDYAKRHKKLATHHDSAGYYDGFFDHLAFIFAKLLSAKNEY